MNATAINAVYNADAHVLSMFKDLLLANEEVAFVPSWHNGTGYFDPICDLEETPSHNTRFVDEYGRNGVILWDNISQSNVVVFERYAGRNDYLVYNASRAFSKAWEKAAENNYIAGSGLVADNPIMVAFLEGTLNLASVQERLAAAKAFAKALA